VRFDFEIDFANGGGLQGRDFRLDIDGDDISDAALADYVVRDLRLLMVSAVRIRNKQIFVERHKRAVGNVPVAAGMVRGPFRRFVDLSHTVEHGMITYRGLPAPIVCDFLTREASRAHYAEGTEFHIGRIDLVANTGTYVDSPFHRFAGGADLSELPLASIADLDGLVVRATGMTGRAVTGTLLLGALAGTDVRGKAVLVHTGWDVHWRTDRYFEGHPFLTADAAEYLVAEGAALVGIDSLNIDDTTNGQRPVHTLLLGAGIPIVEHLCGLEQLPVTNFRFSAVPVKVKGMGTFPVRAYGVLPE
jgi:kynurenine formamidase